MKTCASCGGAFDEALPKCPYCGTINEAGAEKEYNKKLERIRKKLDVVDDIAVDDFKHEAGLFFRSLIIAAAATALAAFFYWRTGIGVKNGTYGVRRAEAKDVITETARYHEILAEWNALYDEGRYDEMCNLVRESDRKKLYEWKHQEFYSEYSQLMETEEALAEITPDSSYGPYATAIYGILRVRRALLTSEGDSNLNAEEKAVIEAFLSDKEEEVKKQLDISAETLDELYEKAVESGYLHSDVIYDYAKERWGIR